MGRDFWRFSRGRGPQIAGIAVIARDPTPAREHRALCHPSLPTPGKPGALGLGAPVIAVIGFGKAETPLAAD